MSNSRAESRLERSIAVLHKIEDATLALLLGAMILLAPLQIFLRNFFDAGIAWADPLLRVLVLWVGLLGALAASRGHRHITIDVFSRLLNERAQRGVRALTDVFTAVVAGLVAFHGGRFVATELEFGSIAFAGLPAWIFQAIIPVCFGLIALRYLLHFAADLRASLVAEPPAA